MINTGSDTPQVGYRYLLQKNARCPICGGSLKRYLKDEIIIQCINCKTSFNIIEPGMGEGDFLVGVKRIS